MLTDSASTSSFSSFCYGWTHDVFLSFRGQDTRFGFTGNLYNSLCLRGIHTFIDDEQLQRGNGITPTLVKAIQESKIAIVVLSENYASSSFCLDELVTILDCSKSKGALVLPIFYDVDPSHVRHLRRSYGEALAEHEKKFKDNMDDIERLENWKMALHQVANLSGWHFKLGDGYEYKFIGSIVEVVSNKINRPPLHIADHPVGLEFQVLQVNSLLCGGSDDGVRMVGIYGIGGIGKTTVARAVYNLIAHQFDGLCFLEDVRKHGLVHLQETLLSEIVGEKDIKLRSVSQGIPTIKHRLQHKKVLLVLDDVDELKQLRATVGEPDWFGSGSKVIITTRDKHLLTSHGVERRCQYQVKELNKNDALELLSWNAFKTDKVDPSYLDILSRAVTYACGLPLALEVIGSNLSGKTRKEWKSALDQYERIPDKQIQDILKISFDSLKEHEQNIFLDIACFFKGSALAYVKEILYAHHGVCPESGIGVLVEKSLIKINGPGTLVTLHDLLEDMGKEIVRQESREEPGERSRLWFHEDIVQVLEENMGTSTIQIIILDFLNIKVDWDGTAFKEMKNLKTLIIRNVCFSEGPKHLPNSLRVLEWQGYPSTSLPSDFYPKKLLILNLPRSCLMSSELFMSKKKFVNLTFLSFNDCQRIEEIPDVSGVPNLETLSLRCCENLIRIHESVGFLDKLRILDASYCRELTTFPPIKLTSLKQLQLSGCSTLESFPEILGKIEGITELELFHTGIKELPFSIQYLTRLQRLKVNSRGIFCRVSLPPLISVKFQKLKEFKWADEWLQSSKEDRGEEKVSSIYSSNLEYVNLNGCNISDEFLGKGLTWFANVKSLNLSANNFTILPAWVKECHLLRELYLDDCKLLRQIKGIPPNLETLSAKGCTSLNDIELTVLPACTEECHSLREQFLDNCENLREITGVPSNIGLLSANNFTILPAWVKECRLLRELYLDDCKLLRQIKGIPPNLETLSAKGCTSLNDLDLTVLPACTEECHSLRELFLDNCENLQEITGIPSNIGLLSLTKCKSLTSLCRSMLLNQELHERAGFTGSTFILPGTRIPEWFEHRSSGQSIPFWFRNNFPTLSVCVVVEGVNSHPFLIPFGFGLAFHNIEGTVYGSEWDLAGNIFIFDKLQRNGVGVLLENEWNHAEVSVDPHVCNDNDHSGCRDAMMTITNELNGDWPKKSSLLILSIGLHVVKQESCTEDIRFTDPYKRCKLNDSLITSE